MDLVGNEDIFYEGCDKTRFSCPFVTADANANCIYVSGLARTSQNGSKSLPVAMLLAFHPQKPMSILPMPEHDDWKK